MGADKEKQMTGTCGGQAGRRGGWAIVLPWWNAGLPMALFCGVAWCLLVPETRAETAVSGGVEWEYEVDDAGKASVTGGTLEGNVTIPSSLGGHAVTAISDESSFEGSPTSLVIAGGVTNVGDSAFCMMEELESVTFGNKVRRIGEGAFDGCRELGTLVLPDSVESIGVNAFCGCWSLESVKFGKGLSAIPPQAFEECRGLKALDIPDNVREIGRDAFWGCCSLEEISIGNGVRSIGDSAFDSCTNLSRLDLGQSVETIGDWAFDGSCLRLGRLVIPDSVTHVGEGAFGECTNVAELVVGDGLESLDGFWFGPDGGYGSEKLVSVSIGNGVTNLPDSLFAECANLTSVALGRNVASIGDWAFEKCAGLKTLTIPASVTHVGYEAFKKSGLGTLYVPAWWKGTDILEESDLPAGCKVVYGGEEPPPVPPPVSPYAAWLAEFGKTPEEMPEGDDEDGDGATNGEEFAADTNPCNPDDCFTTRMRVENGVLVLEASSASTGRVYGVMVFTNLMSLGEFHFLGTGDGLKWTCPVSGTPACFATLTVGLPE